MSEVLSEQEAAPASYPPPPGDMSTEAQSQDATALWRRLEQWIAHRWGERSVTWVVQGPGTWQPRLRPASIDTSEVWRDGTWQTVTLDAAPLGYELDAATYRVTATVGEPDDPPDDVVEAYRRLAEYLADDAFLGRVATAGTRSLSDQSITSERPTAWQAKALHHSGAADLLRRYR